MASDLKRFQFNCVEGVEEEDKVYEKAKFLEVLYVKANIWFCPNVQYSSQL